MKRAPAWRVNLVAWVLQGLLLLLIGLPLFLCGDFAEGVLNRFYNRFGYPSRKETALAHFGLLMIAMNVLIIAPIVVLIWLVVR